MRSAVVWLCSMACSYAPPGGTNPDVDVDSAVDPEPDSMIIPDDGPAPCVPFTHGDVCGLTPEAAITITGANTIDTDDDPRCVTFPQSAGSDACLVYATSIEITASGGLEATGSRPLFLASASTLTIGGKLDGSSHRLGTTGPNSNFTTCAHAQNPEADGGGGGGGAGGSFAAAGGNGGTGDNDNSSGTTGNAARGVAGGGVSVPAFARGGCGGQRGGNGGSGENGGAPGASGGAIVLLAVDRVGIDGQITVNGAGGGGGDTQAGAGGAGSGGMVIVESPIIELAGKIMANGGGGGEGGNRDNGINIDGNPGADGNADAAAAGGDGATPFGGAGGFGSFTTTQGGAPGAVSIVGGGGGGGGTGYIVFLGTRTGAGVTSPAITPQ